VRCRNSHNVRKTQLSRHHPYSLLGRNGEEGELPPITSLPEPFLKFIGPRKHVPALVGKNFVMKYGEKTLAEVFTLFPRSRRHNPGFRIAHER
jgi:hypothetical protein